MKTNQLRLPTMDDVAFVLDCLPEDQPIKGNCMASGDDKIDKEAEKWVVDELDKGNEWAWCTARVKARWRGIEGIAYLGCCSYRSEADFRTPGGYFDDMKQEAFEDLLLGVQEVIDGLTEE